MRPVTLLLVGACSATVLIACSGESPQPPVQSSREYAQQREREMMDTGPTWPQRLAAAPGRDDIDRAISLLKTTGGEHYDHNAVDFLANELSIARDQRTVDALIEVVANASFPSRDLAATALARYGETQARNVIMERLKDGHFAGPLISALGQLGDERTMRELEYMAERSDDPLVAQNANLARGLIEQRLKSK